MSIKIKLKMFLTNLQYCTIFIYICCLSFKFVFTRSFCAKFVTKRNSCFNYPVVFEEFSKLSINCLYWRETKNDLCRTNRLLFVSCPTLSLKNTLRMYLYVENEYFLLVHKVLFPFSQAFVEYKILNF